MIEDTDPFVGDRAEDAQDVALLTQALIGICRDNGCPNKIEFLKFIAALWDSLEAKQNRARLH